jgi:DGQHR domain-containing protein
MNIPVMRVEQAGRVLYLGRMTAGELLETCVTTEWDPAKGWDLQQQGYQRTPVPKHYMAIGRFLANEEPPLMPTAALLSARERQYGQLKFVEGLAGDGYEFGHLVVPEGRLLYIVDYQHRWRGFRHAIDDLRAKRLGDYVVPVVIMRDVPTYDEIMQFYLVNSKQRRVDTDLALALLQTLAQEASLDELYNLVGPGKRYRVRATRLTFRIAACTSGPWRGRIKQPHDLPEPEAVLALKSFADSLQPIVSSRSPVSHLPDDQLLDVLQSYWLAIAELMPEAFSNPRGYSIQKTPGAFSMHIVAAKTVLKICTRDADYSSARIKQILGAAPGYMNSQFWVTLGQVKAFGGSGGHRELAGRIREEIERRFPV